MKDNYLHQLIEQEKQKFILSNENKSAFIKVNNRALDANILWVIFGSALPFVLSSTIYTYLPTSISTALFCFSMLILLCSLFIPVDSKATTFLSKIMFKFSSKEKIRQKITPLYDQIFYAQTISEDVHNIIKLKLNLEEYKSFRTSYNTYPDITYNQVIKFFKEKELNQDRNTTIEQEKHTLNLTTSEIRAYKMENVL